MRTKMITQIELKDTLNNDHNTGEFSWLVSRAKWIKIGDRAGCIHKSTGYRVIRINGKNYYEHRLAWLYHYGYLPTKQIDHINRDRTDNRIANLREVSPGENKQNRVKQSNNTSGFKGVTKKGNRWMAQIWIDGEKIYLGTFDSPQEGDIAYQKAALQHHPFRPTC